MKEGALGVEKFDPRDPKYKKVEDLPQEAQSYFKNAPEGGFVMNTVLIPENVQHTLWTGGRGMADGPLTNSLMVSRDEFEQRVKSVLKDQAKSGTFTERLKAFRALYIPTNDYNFTPTETGMEAIGKALNEATMEAALLTNEGLTKYKDLHFERGDITRLEVQHAGHEVGLGAVTPISINGTMDIDGQSHRLEIIYLINGYDRTGENGAFGHRVKVDQVSPELKAVYFDGKELALYGTGKDVADKIFPAIIMRMENMPDTQDKAFSKNYAMEFDDVIGRVNQKIANNAKARALKEAEEARRRDHVATEEDKFVEFVKQG